MTRPLIYLSFTRLNHNTDQNQFSPKNTNTLSRDKVVINHAMITKGKNALIFKQ